MSNGKTPLMGQSLLVVDDDLACVRMTSLILTAHGATVHSAHNGVEALQVLETTPVDLIISDLLMPEMNGWELIKQIKSTPALRSIPVIAMTANFLNNSDHDRAASDGFLQILPKPLSVQSLMDAITSSATR